MTIFESAGWLPAEAELQESPIRVRDLQGVKHRTQPTGWQQAACKAAVQVQSVSMQLCFIGFSSTRQLIASIDWTEGQASGTAFDLTCLCEQTLVM